MTKEEFDRLRDGDKVITNQDAAWGDRSWKGVVVIVSVDENGVKWFRREKDGANCGPGPMHIELYEKAKIKPLPLPG